MSLRDAAATALTRCEQDFEASVREFVRETLDTEPASITVHRPLEFAGESASPHPIWTATFTVDGLHFGVQRTHGGEPKLLLMHDAESVPGRYSCVAQIRSLTELGAVLATDLAPC